jgi:flavin-dependent dehydrogenase
VAARQLAAGGARVLLVDRCAFPRSKVCGACVNGHALSLLSSIGLGPRIGRLDGSPLRQFQVQSRWHGARLPLADSIAVSRSRFDAALVEAAIEAGASFLPETSAALDSPDAAPSEFRSVVLNTKDRPPQRISGRVVLSADGLGHSSLRQQHEFRCDIAPEARIGLGAVIDGFPADYDVGTISMALGTSGYAGLVRIEDGSLNVAAAMDPAAIKSHGGPAKAVAAILNEARMPEIPALGAAAWHGTAPLTRRTNPVAARRVFVLGDAAGYVEPFTGEGIAWAVSSAVAVVPLALEAMEQWSDHLASRWGSAHSSLIRRRQGICRFIAAGSRHPAMVRGLVGALSLFPSLAGPVVRRVNGSAACRPVHGA